ncbi:MAG: undecaprenyl-diphosphate phosphatase [Ruminococcaceae bacterium]|nr:undecaprenyl-diphosphate phosphatase [Oscillospiraceae bacterium]
MLDYLLAVLYGVVEGITEWLPISSTGHLIILEELLPMQIQKEVWSLFLVVIQLGAILATVILFWNKIWPFQKPDRANGVSIFKKESWMLWFKVAVASIPGVIFKVLGLDDICDKYFYNGFGVAIALAVFGVAFIVIERFNKLRVPKYNDLGDITFTLATYIGLFQLLAAAFPGTSRSGATIIGALILGASRVAASEFTFVLAIPAMLGASLFEFKDFLEADVVMNGNEIAILIIGVAVAFIVSVLAIKFLMGYIKKRDFTVFGYYRIVLGIIVLLYFILR